MKRVVSVKPFTWAGLIIAITAVGLGLYRGNEAYWHHVGGVVQGVVTMLVLAWLNGERIKRDG